MQTDLPAIRADDTALFLDVDGTLLDIQSVPSDVSADADLIAVLKRLRDVLGGALCLVSGRSLAEIDRVFSQENFSAAGSPVGRPRRGRSRQCLRRTSND